MSCSIDHLTITTPTLEEGAAFVRQALGVDMQAGGEHPRMGTHNLLLRLGEAVYMEVIAVNPHAPAPARPRWFGLDALVPGTSPSLATWVARTPDIQAAAAQSTEPLGVIESMNRGAFNWLMTIPANGCLPLSGVAPTLIEWQRGGHPCDHLAPQGLWLERLELHHPQPRHLTQLLEALRFECRDVTISEGAPRLVAHIRTPLGLRSI